MEREVQVLCDGKSIPLNAFAEDVVGSTVSALVGSLKGAEGAKEIKVVVKTK
jgi:hypothetical protein